MAIGWKEKLVTDDNTEAFSLLARSTSTPAQTPIRSLFGGVHIYIFVVVGKETSAPNLQIGRYNPVRLRAHAVS